MPEPYNWGNCDYPNCYYQTTRCANNYCVAHCRASHEFEHFRPWPESYASALPKLPLVTDTRTNPLSHSHMCLCIMCTAAAAAKAAAKREGAAADAAKLPAVYKPPPVEPILGKMEESDAETKLDWPLEPMYWKAKTVYTP